MKILTAKLILCIIALICATFCTFIECGSKYKITPPRTTWAVVGYVKDSINNLPIDSAKIGRSKDVSDTTPAYFIYTDSVGYYELVEPIAPNTREKCWLYASKEGYYSQKKLIELISDTAITVNFNLYPKRR